MNKKKKTLLWELTPPNSTIKSYVFGTIHIRDKRVLQAWGILENKIMICQNYAGEINLDEAENNVSSQSMALPEGESLKKLIGKKNYLKLEKLLLNKLGIPISIFDNSHPILVSQFIAGMHLNKDLDASQDEILWNFAKGKGLECSGIESIEEQLDTFAKISTKDSVKGLKKIIRKWGSIRKDTQKLVAAYLTKNPQKIFKITNKQAKGMRKILIFNRNKIMAKRIFQLSKKGASFISIGAGHLGGNQGVLKLLKSKGMKIKPIPM